MDYLYYCKKCNKKILIDKPAKESSKEEKCPRCSEIMQRVFNVLGIRTGDGIKN